MSTSDVERRRTEFVDALADHFEDQADYDKALKAWRAAINLNAARKRERLEDDKLIERLGGQSRG